MGSFPVEGTAGTLATTGTLATGFAAGVCTVLGAKALLTEPPDFVDADIPLPTIGGARRETPTAAAPAGPPGGPPRFNGGRLIGGDRDLDQQCIISLVN